MSWGGQPPPHQQGGYQAGGYSGYAPPPQSGPPQFGAPQSGYRPPQYGAPQSGYGPPPSGPPMGGYGPPAPPGVSPELWQWFQSVDHDRSGQITADELQQALLNGNWSHFNAETCRLMIGMFDRDRTGTINIHEFADLWKYIQDWKGQFDRFDTDRSGNINAQELQTALGAFGYSLSPNFCQLCVTVFDRHDRRSMKFDDFIQCCVMLKSLTDSFRKRDTNQNGVINVQYEDFLRMVLDNAVV